MRRTAAILATLPLLASLTLAGPVFAAEAECELSVDPRQGPPGTLFVFSGSGYTPTMLTLSQQGTEPREVELDLGDADPWEYELVATEDDAGKWTVTASIPETECAGRAVIRVTLPGTATAEDPLSTGTQRMALIAASLALVVLFLLATRFFLSRSSRSA